MANEKLPQLPILTAVTGQDLFYVVDVSDTTDDPTGSSKQITRDEILTSVNQIDFNLTAVTTHEEGRVSWNDDIKSLEIDTENPEVQVQVGHEMVIRVNNQTGSILTKGTVVYINGAQGQRPTVTKADYSADTSSASVIGLVAADINNGDNGYVVTSGILEGLNTVAYSAGTSLYLFTGGTYSSNKPQAPDHDVRIGKVIVSNATTGSIYVNVQNGYELDELHDVRITSATTNDMLVRSSYNGIPVWVNTKTLSGLTYVEATTISATTYQNLPVDPNYYTTAFTYSNNVFTIKQTGQADLTATINTVTGWTVNGNLTVTGNTSLQGVTATTVSATTLSANTVYSISATTGTSVANLAIQSDGKIIKAGGNAIVEDYYYSISNSIDTTFYEDDKVIMRWDETGNDIKFTMKVAPGGSGDMRSLGIIAGSTTTENRAIVSTSVEYDLYSGGISAGNRFEGFVTAENDVTYPAYRIIAYNTGESFDNTIWVQKIIKI